jgi:alkylhydroperoxidase family enzyme
VINGDVFMRLRDTGVSDAEILDALGTMKVFAGFNRILDALQVEIDFA